jgi:anti-sigma B factor antagonist
LRRRQEFTDDNNGAFEMALLIDESQLGDVTLLKLRGQLTMGLDSGELKQRMQKLVTEAKINVIMNIGELNFIDSYGLGELVACLSTLKKSGGSLKLARPTEFVREVLRTTRLNSLLVSYESDEDALASILLQDRAESGE